MNTKSTLKQELLSPSKKQINCSSRELPLNHVFDLQSYPIIKKRSKSRIFPKNEEAIKITKLIKIKKVKAEPVLNTNLNILQVLA
jgi:hypothetical protein